MVNLHELLDPSPTALTDEALLEGYNSLAASVIEMEHDFSDADSKIRDPDGWIRGGRERVGHYYMALVHGESDLYHAYAHAARQRKLIID